MPQSLIRFAWLAIPMTVLAGDFMFRWGGRLPANLWEAPSNLLATLGLSALVWWATSRLIASSRHRWLWAAAVGLPAAFLVASAWRFAAVSGHDPGATVMIYLWQEPASSLRMMGARFSPGFGLGVVLLAALWVLALGARRTRESSRVTKISCVSAPIIWLFAASLWPAGMTVGQTPFAADFHITHTLIDGATQIARGRATSALGVGERTVLEAPSQASTSPRQVDGPNVIVFIAESLRKDRMQLYGHDRATTPNMVEFFDGHPDQVHRFERATSTSAFTHLSVPAILSGLHMAHSRERMHRAPVIWHYARAAGAESFLVTAQDWGWQHMDDFLLLDGPPDHVHTARSIGTPIVNDVGIDDRYATEVLVELIGEQLDADRPFAGVVQANATHFPFLASDDVDWELETVRDIYDSAITVTDAMFGQMVDALAEAGQLDDTVIIFVADHSEFFYDVDARDSDAIQQAFQDGVRVRSCHPAITSIPMFVYLPDKWAGQIDGGREALQVNQDRPISTVDVVPTVLQLWGIEQTARGPRAVDGRSLLEPIAAERAAFCFNTAGWQLQPGSGFGVMDSERAIYGRSDLERLHVYDLDDPSSLAERGPGAAPGPDERVWLERIVRDAPFVAPYLDYADRGGTP